MSNGTCSLASCAAPIKRAGYCYGHYMKNWRYGTPTPDHGAKWVDVVGQRFGSLVVLRRSGIGWTCACDCGAESFALAGNLNRGDTSSCGDRALHRRRDDIGYSAAHCRVRSDVGRVQDHDCVDCGKQARHWSYNHTDPNEMYAANLSKHPVAYSSNPDHYSPRCVPCHRRFDLGRLDAHRVA